MFSRDKKSIRRPNPHSSEELFKSAVLGNVRDDSAQDFNWTFDAPSDKFLGDLHFIRELLVELRGGRSPPAMVEKLRRETKGKKVADLARELQHRHQEWDANYSRLVQTLDRLDMEFRRPLCAIPPLRQVAEAIYGVRPGDLYAYLGVSAERAGNEQEGTVADTFAASR
jgi:hypothetical protein